MALRLDEVTYRFQMRVVIFTLCECKVQVMLHSRMVTIRGVDGHSEKIARRMIKLAEERHKTLRDINAPPHNFEMRDPESEKTVKTVEKK